MGFPATFVSISIIHPIKSTVLLVILIFYRTEKKKNDEFSADIFPPLVS